MTDTKDNVIGGYYYEQGKSMTDAKILDENKFMNHVSCRRFRRNLESIIQY